MKPLPHAVMALCGASPGHEMRVYSPMVCESPAMPRPNTPNSGADSTSILSVTSINSRPRESAAPSVNAVNVVPVGAPSNESVALFVTTTCE